MYRETLDNAGADLRSYMNQIANHCPFTKPSQKAGVLYFTDYVVEKQSIKTVLLLAILHIEILRRDRVVVPKKKSFLLCDNLVIDYGERLSTEECKKVFDWVHYICKCIYIPKKLIFGKFWKGEEAQDRHGVQIPAPPVNLFSIRTLLNPNDIRFLEKSPKLLEEFHKSMDDLGDVFADLSLDASVASIFDSVAEANEKALVIESMHVLYQIGFFEQVLSLVGKIEERQGTSFVQKLRGSEKLLSL